MKLGHSALCKGDWNNGPDRPVHCDNCAYAAGFEAGCATPMGDEQESALKDALCEAGLAYAKQWPGPNGGTHERMLDAADALRAFREGRAK